MLLKIFPSNASVLKIKEARDSSDCFSFKLVTIEDMCQEILALDASKATQRHSQGKTVSCSIQYKNG